MKLRRLWRGALYASFLLLGLPIVAHLAIRYFSRLTPPEATFTRERLTRGQGDMTRLGAAYALRRDKIWEVRLVGSPEQIGYQHATLLRRQMIENEGVLFRHLQATVPNRIARWALLDLAQLRFRTVHRSMSDDRLRELAAEAIAFGDDPYADIFPTFQRFVYLNALYDISLSFEHSPLIGCTSFVSPGSEDRERPPLLARAFDFEVDPIFDRDKVVFLVRETGKIPFASVAWPGLVGVLSGMNSAGLALVVHGGRAGETFSHGEPVVHALRRVLSTAKTIEQAVAALQKHSPMVSHIVVVQDESGRGAVLERVPEKPVFVRRLSGTSAVTNHFEGPAKAHEKNEVVKRTTSSVPRRQRADELVRMRRAPPTAREAVELLRDKKGLGGSRLSLGDRNAIDALIATHGVVMNTRDRILWVSQGPHLLGAFVRFDLDRLLQASYQPDPSERRRRIPPDPLLDTPAYRAFLSHKR